jgi:hypothetical protein
MQHTLTLKDETVSELKTSAYRALNTFHLGYKNQSVNVVWGNNGCLF